MLDIFTTTTMEDALRYLKDNPGARITATARLFNVNRSTLGRRSRGVTVSRKQYLTTINKNLSITQEKKLIKYINKLTERGLPLPFLLFALYQRK
jgi:hypothetical protein